MTIKADEYLNKSGRLVLPDVIMNTGNIITGYLEWMKGISHMRIGRLSIGWKKKSRTAILDALNVFHKERSLEMTEKNLVDVILKGISTNECDATLNYAIEHNVNLRIAAYSIALRRIVENYEQVGFTF